ncbi:PREDICTED: serine/threonine-protein kinase NIM1-like, partial [Priapulus caudatus]|uniref:Serine/threonine-protein kinase NIM1-like n=1 Tax=Priapulus caudatus TaxID=37621 RepID=A0ABM1E7N6_PRICU
QPIIGMESLTKEKVAIKILDKTKLDQKTQRLLSREIANMEQLHHPNIIRLYEVVETLSKLYIVMEYASGGELFHKIQAEGKMAEPDAAHLYAQIISAVEHMHGKNIIHRDIKAENVFFAGQQMVKMGDFGFSTMSQPDQQLNTFCGSPPYAAPELFRDENYIGCYVDIWALGILLYFMVTGMMPFRADTVGKLKKLILDGTYVIPTHTSDSCQFLIRNVLKPLPTDRFTLAQISNSDWLTGNDFPSAHSPYDLMPSYSKVEMKAEEREVTNALRNFGITDEHVKESHVKSSRSSVTGTYRIMLHRAQKKNSEPLEDLTDDEDLAELNEASGKKRKQGNKKSRFCAIL